MPRHEKRTARRFPLELPIIVSGSAAYPDVAGVTRDVSAGGVFFYPKEWQSQFSKISFKIIFPLNLKKRHLVCEGMVLRVEEGTEGRTGVATTIDAYEYR